MTTPRSCALPILATSLALWCILGQHVAAGPSASPFERILAGFNTTAPASYRAVRRLEAGITGSSRHGWLEVWTELNANGMTFEVTDEGGHEYVRNKILRKVLVNEQQLIARRVPIRAALVAQNYSFEDGGTTNTGLQRVILKAVRKAHGVVNGALFFAPDAGYVSRIEGRLVKSPSFWVSDVDVTWTFARIGDHVLPVEMTSSGRVKMLGRSQFKMVYEYVSIDGRSALLNPQLHRQR